MDVRGVRARSTNFIDRLVFARPLTSLPAEAATRTVSGTICQSENDRQKIAFGNDGEIEARDGQRVEVRCPLVLDNDGGGSVTVTLAVRNQRSQGRRLSCTLRSVDQFGDSFQSERVNAQERFDQLMNFDAIDFVESGTVFLDCNFAANDLLYSIEYTTDNE